ncbi:hypothetical protein GUJ93_ZPchr0014g47096 [Zizania palustris]|uniref:Uncharacterized protein n=1 Tax=Zizania palustris TaxID=103762 RepID=A0A8J5W6P8_ZIZPA|nr:hypothetical protein GUJ93_ZPchr0014g47096 [Zizania palustris]
MAATDGEHEPAPAGAVPSLSPESYPSKRKPDAEADLAPLDPPDPTPTRRPPPPWRPRRGLRSWGRERCDDDFCEDLLTEVDLNNILPSRTRRRAPLQQPGAYLMRPEMAAEDDEDADIDMARDQEDGDGEEDSD